MPPIKSSESKTDSAQSGPFVVCLNPSYPEANSWWDPVTGVNLFLDAPFSGDLADVPNAKRSGIYKAIEAGLLIVAQGDLPETFDRSKINHIAPGRVRIATAKFDVDIHPKEHEAQQALVARLRAATEHHQLVAAS